MTEADGDETFQSVINFLSDNVCVENKSEKSKYFNFLSMTKGTTSCITYEIVDVEYFWELVDGAFAKKIIDNDSEMSEREKFFDAKTSLLECISLDHSPLRFDIDFYPIDACKTDKRLYTDKICQKIYGIIIDQLTKFLLKFNQQLDVNTIMTIFSKDTWIKKDGIHIFFPNLLMYNENQNTLSNIIGNEINNKSVRWKLDTCNIKTISVDSVANKSWVVYGFSKYNKQEIYKLTTVYKLSSLKLYIQNKEEWNKPSLYSISRKKYRNENIFGCQPSHTPTLTIKQHHNIEDVYGLLIDTNLLHHLSIDRADNYDDWINIGLRLYSIGKGDERFLELWKKFSIRSAKYNEGGERVCNYKWSTFKVRKEITVRSLLHYLKKDNIAEYNKLEKEYFYNKTIKTLLSTSDGDNLSTVKFQHYDMAEFFYRMYSSEIIYDDKEWWKFNGVSWHKINESDISLLFINPVRERLQNVLKELENENNNMETVFQRKCLERNRDLSDQLKNVSYLNSCYRAAKIICNVYPFTLDRNKYLIGFNNGVVDLRKIINEVKDNSHELRMELENDSKILVEQGIIESNGTLFKRRDDIIRRCFRQADPDDYISKSTNYNYIKDPPKENFNKLYKYLSQIVVDKEEREEMLDLFATCLEAENSEKMIIVIKGTPNSGKTRFINFLCEVFGEYKCTLPREVAYVRRTNSSTPRPELVRAVNTRLGFINETVGNETMDTAMLKQISGQDKMYFRTLYSEGEECNTTWTLVITCNDCPKIPHDDEAIWDRLRFINFNSRFSSDAPLDENEQIKQKTFPRMTVEIDNALQELVPTFLIDLLRRYYKNQLMTKHGIPSCKKLKENTKMFRDDNNPIKVFCDEKIVYCKTKSFVECIVCFNKYKEWFTEVNPGIKLKMNYKTFLINFEAEIKIKHVKVNIIAENNNVERSKKSLIDVWSGIELIA